MHQHLHSFRRNTHIAQKLQENYLVKIQEFLSYNMKLRDKNSYELYVMANVDESLIYLNMPITATVQSIGSKKLILEHKDKKIEEQQQFYQLLNSELI